MKQNDPTEYEKLGYAQSQEIDTYFMELTMNILYIAFIYI